MRNARDIYALLDRGSAKRRTAETLLNKQSSRSHSVFCVTARPSPYPCLGTECCHSCERPMRLCCTHARSRQPLSILSGPSEQCSAAQHVVWPSTPRFLNHAMDLHRTPSVLKELLGTQRARAPYCDSPLYSCRQPYGLMPYPHALPSYPSLIPSLMRAQVHMREMTPDGEEVIKIGKLYLVDLAGSENVSRCGP